MIRKLFRKLFSKSSNNQEGSVLAVTLIVMVVLAASISAVTNLTLDQTAATTLKQSIVNEEVTAKRLLQLASSKLVDYMNEEIDPLHTFINYKDDMIPAALADYGVYVSNVTTEPGFEAFGETPQGNTYVYRFAIPLSSGKDLVMYTYLSTVGSAIELLDVFDFSLGTNGDLVLGGGY